MEIDAWEIIAIIFCYFLCLWGFRFAFFGGIAKMLMGGMSNGKGDKVSGTVGKEEKNTSNRSADSEDTKSDTVSYGK